ncbi:MAG: hypothetical protein ABH836_07550 [Candidatus Omnitrophota bacterium]
MTEETKETFESEDKIVADGKVWAILSYLGILCLLPLLLKKENKFALFHGKQGLVLFIGETAISILSLGISIFAILWPLGFLLFGTLSITGIIQVLMGKYWKMPIAHDLSEKFKI